MGVKPDSWIIRMAQETGMIEPFEQSLVSGSSISFGPSSYGYDFRVAREFRIFRGGSADLVDPKCVADELFESFEGECCIVPPGSFVLARSVEYFRIPREILTICAGKSTYARCGILVNVTPFEPEWEGYVTMSVANTGTSPVRVYAGEGIAQLVFLSADEPCRVSYRDRKGKYQAQRGIVLSKVQGESIGNSKESLSVPATLLQDDPV